MNSIDVVNLNLTHLIFNNISPVRDSFRFAMEALPAQTMTHAKCFKDELITSFCKCSRYSVAQHSLCSRHIFVIVTYNSLLDSQGTYSVDTLR